MARRVFCIWSSESTLSGLHKKLKVQRPTLGGSIPVRAVNVALRKQRALNDENSPRATEATMENESLHSVRSSLHNMGAMPPESAFKV